MTPERWQLIQQLYYDSQDRTPQERAAWLAEACAGDDTLRREVEILLAANEQASHFLHTPAFQLEAPQLAESSLILPSGERFGHYQILAKIGAGGMGEVYLAEDTSLERKVALKVLPPRFTADAGRLQRFIREAKTASALNHPNIITIYEIGQQGDIHFIATEYIEGVTLRQQLGQGKLDLRLALEVARQIAAALDTAHRAGIIHRDIKPENIMHW
jgi:eukaryotic-like serine/threonine-protein kinase